MAKSPEPKSRSLRDQYGGLVPTGRLHDGKPRSIMFDATKCIGCRHCVQACKDWNDHPRTSLYGLSSTTWITMEPPVLEGLSPLWARNSCMHCDFPACAAVCPVEAITKYEEGPVVINREICIGCEYCIYACPWEVIARDDIAHKAAKRTAEINGYLYGDREAGGGGVVYVLKEKKAAYGVRSIGPQRFPRHKIPLSLMLKDLFTLRCGIRGKLRALYLAVAHPRRLLYRYWPWGNTPQE